MPKVKAEVTGLRITDIQYLESVLSQFADIEQCVIFGSRAKGNYRNGSDVDLAIMGNNIHFETISKLSYILNEESPMPYHFDVIHFERIENTDLKEHISRVGIVLYNK
jgi:predicted nucleotidyltransferase